jgi:tRNA(fMet)-specific endonuclease VapC
MPTVLLDTDILSELIKRRNPAVERHALSYSRQHGRLAFSAMTRYEIVRGYAQRAATLQLARFEAFCQQSLILSITDAILDRAADLWAFARNHGHPHNDADLIIAATALENGRSLVTGNTTHFDWIPGLVLTNWRQP